MSASQAKRARRAARFSRADVLATLCQCPSWPAPHVETYQCHEGPAVRPSWLRFLARWWP